MTILLLHHFLLLLSLLSIFHLHYAFILPITKDVSTLQYIAKFHHDTTPLVVDLNGPFLWTHCSSRHVSSSHQSLHCSITKAHGPRSGPEPNKIHRGAFLAEDILTVEDAESISTVHHHKIIYYCAPTLFFKGLASGARGVLGLGKVRTSVQSQIAMSQGQDRKFSICLSSSKGFINFGGGGPHIDILKSLAYTPLIKNVNGMREYFINVKSVKINGKRINLLNDRNTPFDVKISTTSPYTTMQSAIYATFTKAYVKFATSMNMTRVNSVVGAPFEICYSSKNIGMTPLGPMVPVIDLVMQSELVKLRIYGRNSMVRVSDQIMCLGFLDGGSNSGASIVIGGYQLEDHLLQFDIATSMLGFSSSLLARNMSCSNFQSYSTHNVS